MAGFKLPIEYCKVSRVPDTMVADLELVETHEPGGASMYDVLYGPKTRMAKEMVKRGSTLFTTDTRFLKDTVSLTKRNSWKVFPDAAAFADHWAELQKLADFKALYHYVEHDRLTWLNDSPKALLVLGVQSILAPVLFLMSPILVLLIPFALLKVTNTSVSWDAYKVALYDVLKRHALTGAFFGPRNVSNLFSSLFSLVIFGVQMYSNLQSCWQFHKNLSRAHDTLERTERYLAYTTEEMERCVALAPPRTHRAFCASVKAQCDVLRQLLADVRQVRALRYGFGELKQLGYVRFLLYRLKYHRPWVEATEFSFGFVGYVENMAHLKGLLTSGRLAPCRFGKRATVKFSDVHYPPNPDHVKHTYALDETGKVVTGPNASGKTTFIKTAMLGVLFSQQVGCGFYARADLRPFRTLCCYLNIPDTSGRDSLFQAEARRCKEILALVSKGDRTFCIFDELFSGTNPYEASASAFGLLTHMGALPNVKLLLTTHFLDLCTRLDTNPRFKNVHMKTRAKGAALTYEYKLVEGISSVKGGLQVLRDLHFPASIVECAQNF
jgi:hypothetical protein